MDDDTIVAKRLMFPISISRWDIKKHLFLVETCRSQWTEDAHAGPWRVFIVVYDTNTQFHLFDRSALVLKACQGIVFKTMNDISQCSASKVLVQGNETPVVQMIFENIKWLGGV